MTEPSLVLEPETRIVWASASARAQWAPRIALADAGYRHAERQSVAEGWRGAGQAWLSIHDYLAFLPWAHANGLTVHVVRWTGSHQGFWHGGYPPGNDMAVVVYGKVIKQPYDEQFGYPECCRAFFAREFPLDVDPVPAWAQQGTKEVRPLANPLLRYIGPRATAHIPCRPTCEETVKWGNAFLSLMSPEAAAAARDLLSLPVRWDRYRGVAIIDTPYFKVVTTSTPRPIREIVEVPHVVRQ